MCADVILINGYDNKKKKRIHLMEYFVLQLFTLFVLFASNAASATSIMGDECDWTGRYVIYFKLAF